MSTTSLSSDIGTLISWSPDLHSGRPVIAETGTSVRCIAGLYKQGKSAEEIYSLMNHLSLAQIYAALAHYHANKLEIEADIAAEEEAYWKIMSLQDASDQH